MYFVSAGTNVLRRGDFPLRNKSPEQIALEWWHKIKTEMHTDYLDKVIANGEDITDKVKALLNE